MLYKKLRGKLKEVDIEQKHLAEKLNLGQPISISKRMTGKVDWRISEMYAILDLINEPYDQLHIYFPKGGKDIAPIKEAVSCPRGRYPCLCAICEHIRNK